MGTTIDTTHFVGMDFSDPNLDMQDIATAFGARTEKIDKLGSIEEVLRRASGARWSHFSYDRPRALSPCVGRRVKLEAEGQGHLKQSAEKKRLPQSLRGDEF